MAGTTGLEPATSDVKGQQSVRNSENLCPRKLRGEPTGSSFGKGESDEPCKDRRKARPGRLPTHEGQFRRRLTSSGGVPDRQNDIWLAGRWRRETSKVGAEQCCRASAGRRCCGRSSRLPFGRVPSRRCMRITFRPNLFGRSFGRKLGVLYDDYVKDVFVSACGINKREDDIVLHTQEVTGSSPVAPTIRINDIQTDNEENGVPWERKWVGNWRPDF